METDGNLMAETNGQFCLDLKNSCQIEIYSMGKGAMTRKILPSLTKTKLQYLYLFTKQY